MTKIKVSHNFDQLTSPWLNVPDFKHKNKHINVNGKMYYVTEKKERHFSSSEILARKIMGAVALFFSAGLLYMWKPVRKLFTKEKTSRYAISEQPSQNTQTTNTPVEKKKETTLQSRSKQDTDPTAPHAILYMSITGNPTHLGHMAAVASAIDALFKKSICVDKVFISLSPQSYLDSKINSENTKIKKENNKGGFKKPLKIQLNFDERLSLLNGTIQEAANRKMFAGVAVEFWNDQDQGYSDHPDSYKRLTKENPTKQVYLVAGSDLCERMGNWVYIVAHAIIVSRGEGDPSTEQCTEIDRKYLKNKSNGTIFVKECSSQNFSRTIAKGKYPDLEVYSSSAIQTGKMKLFPQALQDIFDQAQKRRE